MAAQPIECLETSMGEFELPNWNLDHDMHAVLKTGCIVQVGKPKIAIRLYLKRMEKLRNMFDGNSGYYSTGWWYNLHADVLKAHGNVVAIRVTATESAGKVSKVGVVNDPRGKDVQVIDEFVHMKTKQSQDSYGFAFTDVVNGAALTATTLKITVKVELFHAKGDNGLVRSGAETETLEAEESISTDLKSMYESEDIYGDLKVETKDGTTFDAHKFLLAARSRYLRVKLEKVMKNNDFDGVLKIDEVNGKPMQVILHWMYTGELHEIAASVMEEVTEAAVLFELNQLLKVLDKKLITICTKQNMFRLYTVAQKTAMPNASTDISAFIKENLVG